MLQCSCVLEGKYCTEAVEWVKVISRLGKRSGYELTLAQENCFSDAWRQWNFHMGDVNKARSGLGLPVLDLDK